MATGNRLDLDDRQRKRTSTSQQRAEIQPRWSWNFPATASPVSASPFITHFYGSEGFTSPTSPRRAEGESYLYPPRFYRRPEAVAYANGSGGGSESAESVRADSVSSRQPRRLKRKRKATKEEQIKEKKVEDEAKDVVEFPPVPFFALFRFTTRSEMFINFIGIACAIAAGAAQVSISSILKKRNLILDVAAYDTIVWKSYECVCQVWKGRTGTCCLWSNTRSVGHTRRRR
jgi:hypothetical protein